MLKGFSYFKLQRDIDRIKTLFFGHLLFFFSGEILYSFKVSFGLWDFTRILIILGFLRLIYLTIEKLYYTFWSFSFIVACYLIYIIVESIYLHGSWQLAFPYIVALIFLAVECHTLYSPIYYPIVSWWEYDFRYRDELKISVHHEDNSQEGRLSDLRRGAGCLTTFKEFSLGDVVKVDAEESIFEGPFEIEIMSSRQYSLGRPHTYGVKFILDSDELADRYARLVLSWRTHKKVKTRSKFLKVGSDELSES